MTPRFRSIEALSADIKSNSSSIAEFVSDALSGLDSIGRELKAVVHVATMRFAIGIEGSERVNATSGEGRSDAWLASEYLADDLSEVLKGGSFAARISERTGITVPTGTIFASREHRIMTVTVTWGDRDEVQAIAEAVGAAVEDGGADYFPQLAGVEAQAVLIDGPGIGQAGRSLCGTRLGVGRG